MRGSVLAAAVFMTLVSGCSVELKPAEVSTQATNECRDTSECLAGRCELSRCVAEEGAFDTLLLEVTPPISAARAFGGVRFLETRADMARNTRTDLELAEPVRVRGFVRAYEVEGFDRCLAGAERTQADATLPMEVTLTPRNRILGLSAPGYTAVTELKSLDANAAASHPCNRDRDQPVIKPEVLFHEFTLTVPAGEYDIYARSLLSDDPTRPCQIVPYLVRQRDFPERDVCANLQPPEPQTFTARVEWPATEGGQSLDGWTAEIIHPVTGEVLSTRQVLQAESDAPGEYLLELQYSRPTGTDSGAANEELLRLSPPEPQLGPVIQLKLQLLDPFGEDGNVIADLRPFPAPVQVETWVWEAGPFEERDQEVPVAASVTLTAIHLDGIADGVFASYSVTAEAGQDGRLVATVLPGEYRVRVVPEAGSGLAATEVALAVACDRDPANPSQCLPRAGDDVVPDVRAVRTFLVPSAATVDARVRLFDVSDSLRGATVDARPGQIRGRWCPEGVDAGQCDLAPVDLLDVSLGAGAFVPRSDSVLTDQDGRFALDLDCGSCDEEGGAVFDLSVRPEPGTGFPWLVRPGLTVRRDTSLGDMKLPLPLVHRGTVQIPQAAGESVAVGGALIRAYIYRDALGRYVDDPEQREDCGVDPADTECLRSVLQVGEARATADGTYELVLPSRLD